MLNAAWSVLATWQPLAYWLLPAGAPYYTAALLNVPQSIRHFFTKQLLSLASVLYCPSVDWRHIATGSQSAGLTKSVEIDFKKPR